MLKKVGYIILVIMVGVFALISIFIKLSDTTELILIIIIVLVSTLLIIHRIWLKNTNKRLMSSFAKKHGFDFVPNLSNWQSNSQLLNSGLGRKISNYMRGEYKGVQIEIYNYFHTFDYIKYSRDYEYIVFESKVNKKLPTAIITGENNYLSQVLYTLDLPVSLVADKLETESNDFNKDFKIFLEKNYRDDNKLQILGILTPDIMAILVDENTREKGKDIHVEMNDNSLLLYLSIEFNLEGALWDKLIKNESDLQKLLDLLYKLIEAAGQ